MGQTGPKTYLFLQGDSLMRPILILSVMAVLLCSGCQKKDEDQTLPQATTWQGDFSTFKKTVGELWSSLGDYKNETAAQRALHIEKFNQKAAALFAAKTVTWTIKVTDVIIDSDSAYKVCFISSGRFTTHIKSTLTPQEAEKIKRNGKVVITAKIKAVISEPTKVDDGTPGLMELPNKAVWLYALVEEPVTVTLPPGAK
jgi:hypothetical protein